MFLVPLCILMSIYAVPTIRIFYSQRFALAAGPMSIFVFGVGFLTVFYVLTFVLNGAGKVKVPMIISFVGLAVNIVATYFLIKKYALYGAVVGTSIMTVSLIVRPPCRDSTVDRVRASVAASQRECARKADQSGGQTVDSARGREVFGSRFSPVGRSRAAD